MSTNPFDDEDVGGVGVAGGGMPTNEPHRSHPPPPRSAMVTGARHPSQRMHHQHRHPPSAPTSQHQHQHHHHPHHHASHPEHAELPPPPSSHQHQQQQQQSQAPPIWAARGVEWPLPPSLDARSYRRLRRESRAVGRDAGIATSGMRLPPHLLDRNREPYGGDGGGSNERSAFAPRGGGGDDSSVYSSKSRGTRGGGSGATTAMAEGEGTGEDRSTDGSSMGGEGTASVSGGGGGYGGLTGLMGRVLGASSQSASASAVSLSNVIEEEDLAVSSNRTVLPPRARCVAASNGWIVAAVECVPPPLNAASSVDAGGASLPSSSKHGGAASSGVSGGGQHHSSSLATSLLPPLRLVSRWNVRRGTSLGSEGNHLISLPPPVRTYAGTGGGTNDADVGWERLSPQSSSSSTWSDPNFGRILHAFVDPTGCHVLLSARNGEAYYVHSTSKRVKKLSGFGPVADGTYGGFVSGAAAGDVGGTGGGGGGGSSGGGGGGSSARDDPAVQTGLTPGSYITAVGWDRDRGTEGSTKRILLGTSFGEIYEYALVSPNAASSSSASASPFSVVKRGGGGGGGGGNAGGISSGSDGVGIGKGKTSAFDAKAAQGQIGGAVDDGDEHLEAPVLLRRLNATTASPGRGRGSGGEGGGGGDLGAVGGIIFQRVGAGGASKKMGHSKDGGGGAGPSVAGSGYLLVLASTGGAHKHTRLHTFRSAPSSSIRALTLRAAFSRQADGTGRGSFVELPGSVDFADLRNCNDGFIMRTETGVYFGTIERTGASGVSMSVGVGGIVDAGMLSYDTVQGSTYKGSVGGMIIPASIGLTPHHFITLSATNEIRFINRVAKNVIQQERVDDSFAGGGGTAELLMDIRRPDQIWLRKGRSLVHISSSCEDRDVWKFTLAKCIETVPHHTGGSQRGGAVADGLGSNRHTVSSGLSTIPPLTSEEKYLDGQFEYAKSLCSNASQKAVVNTVRAEYHLSQGRVELAAKYLSQCPATLMPFADTAIRLALPMLGADGSINHINSNKANEALANSNMALITYLSEKMRTAKSQNDTLVCTMLGAWLTELHLHERERDGAGKPVYLRQSHRHLPAVNNALLHHFLSSYVRDMDAKTIIEVLGSHDISASECAGFAAASGDIGAAIGAALCGEDTKNGALDALRVLNDSPIEKAEPYYHKHAPTLLARAPMAASKSFLARYTEGLSETQLLPAFMYYEQKRSENRKSVAMATKAKAVKGMLESTGNRVLNQLASSSKSANARQSDKVNMQVTNLQIEGPRAAGDSGVEIRIDHAKLAIPSSFVDDENASVKYMEGVINLGCQSPAIFNYLTSLYANMEDEAPLFRFLSAHVPAANTSLLSNVGISGLLFKQSNEEHSSPLDKAFALRTILRTGRHFRSAVKLYMGFGMRQQAVELALKVDPSLARELARQSDDKNERKRLWLMIARNAASNGGNRDGKDVVARVVSVLKDCGPDVLSIEDVLPFLPDFAQIDQFKDEICEALASYSSKIEQYLKEMNECDQTCDALRDELSRLTTVGTQIRADARCAFTNKHVLDEGAPFYVFPSGYVALETPLKREVMPHLNEKQRSRVEHIEKELLRIHGKRNGKGRTVYESAEYDYLFEELQVELDGLIAAECPLTGSVMVESIDMAFADDDETEFV